jgi:muconolactone delta-isomerase
VDRIDAHAIEGIPMKILAIEKEVQGVSDDDSLPFLKAEAARVLELYQSGLLREMYFRADVHSAVLMFECADTAAARDILASLPLVKHGLIAFDTIPLIPYSGFSRLFTS